MSAAGPIYIGARGGAYRIARRRCSAACGATFDQRMYLNGQRRGGTAYCPPCHARYIAGRYPYERLGPFPCSWCASGCKVNNPHARCEWCHAMWACASCGRLDDRSNTWAFCVACDRRRWRHRKILRRDDGPAVLAQSVYRGLPITVRTTFAASFYERQLRRLA